MNKPARLTAILLLAGSGLGFAQSTTWTVSDRLTIGSTTLGPADLEVAGKIGAPTSPSLRVSGDGGVIFTGNYGAGLLPTSTATSQLIWYPRKAAILGGAGANLVTSDSDIGKYSFSFGNLTRATNWHTMAFGYNAFATGDTAIAIGAGTVASGDHSVALGTAGAYAPYSYAIGGQSGGIYSISLPKSTAWGNYSTAMGTGVAQGDYSVAIGKGVGELVDHTSIPTRYCSTIIGAYNAWEGTSNTTWVPTDPLFTIANGTDDTHRNNAFVIYKNGNVKIAKRQGDVGMGRFGNTGDQ